MKGMGKFRGSRWLWRSCVVCLLTIGAFVQPGSAQVISNLYSLNSSVAINIDGGNGTFAGLASYLVDGTAQVKQHWFYYRIGDAPAAGEQSIDKLGAWSVLPRSDLATLDLSYINSDLGYRARVGYTLTGKANGSGQSQLQETITFYNNSPNSINLRFFDYSDYDIGNVQAGQSVSFWKASTGGPFPNYTTYFAQTMGAYMVSNSMTAGRIDSTHLNASTFSSTLDSLADGTPTTLPDNLTLTASSDATGTIEWDVTLEAGRSLQISRIMSLAVPEPSAVAIFGLGGLAWGLRRQSRGRKTPKSS